MNTPLPDSLLRSEIRKYAEQMDEHLQQEPGQTLREHCPYPLLEVTGPELLRLYRQLQAIRDAFGDVS